MRLYTDIDPFCCEVLSARVADGGLPPGEVWCRDIKTLTTDELKPFTQVHLFAGIGGSPLGFKWAGWPDDWSLVTGGFPCQPVSVAGKGLAQADERWLWPEMHRVIDLVRPDWVCAENVPGLRTRGVDLVLDDLERIGYRCWALVVGADDVGAPHRRKRVWVVGNSGRWTGDGRSVSARSKRAGNAIDGGAGQNVEHADKCGRRLDESRRGQDRGVVAGGTGASVANAARGGLGADRGTLGDAGHADECGQAMANANGERGRGGTTRRQHATDARFTGQGRWPMPPGPTQHEWEAPRLVESRVGVAVDGVSRRLAGFARRNALKALGNSQVPQCVEVIARAMMEVGR